MTRRSINRNRPLHRPWLVWLSVWLALFMALAPTVSYAFHAAASRDAADLHAVCSSTIVAATPQLAPTAPVWLLAKAPQSDDTESPLSAHTCSHCQRCLLCIERLVTLTSCAVGFTIQPETYAEPVAPAPQFVKSFLELNPPPRGPPALS